MFTHNFETYEPLFWLEISKKCGPSSITVTVSLVIITLAGELGQWEASNINIERNDLLFIIN